MDLPKGLRYSTYEGEKSLSEITALVEKDLSEPYSVFTYRYFVNVWPMLCEMIHNEHNELVGVVVCKMDDHAKSGRKRGYIGMLAIREDYRKLKLATKLVQIVLERMKNTLGADECILEAEVTNLAALSLYHHLGFFKTKYLHNYYLSGSDAFRLKHIFTPLAID